MIKVQSYSIWSLILAQVCNAIRDDTYTCCTASDPCDINQGDCDSDNDCSGYLICGNDNCKSPFPSDVDCCQLGKITTFSIRFNITVLRDVDCCCVDLAISFF